MTNTTVPTYDAEWRQLQHLNPGHWFLGTYPVAGSEDVEDPPTEQLWTYVHAVFTGTMRDGRKIADVRGLLQDGTPARSLDLAGNQVRRLTARQAAKVGLTLPDPETEE